METPYGAIPDRLARDMSPQDMHDYLRARYRRRAVLGGAAVIATPLLWRQPGLPARRPGPRWIGFGADPAAQMHVSWSSGSASGASARPGRPRVRWGLDRSYGHVADADACVQVPVPAVAGEPAEHTFYSNVRLGRLRPGTAYHYSVSNDGRTWSADAVFRTAAAGRRDFRFTAFGDQAASLATAAPMVSLVSSLRPAFHLVAGDLAYATPQGLKIPHVAGFSPAQWDKYLAVVGSRGAQSVPWQACVGAHETEPLGDHGYAGFVTRFPQPYDHSSGSPVVHDFSYGNVAVIQLDGNDLSAQETVNTGYTRGAQTRWLRTRLARYRAAGSGIDFIVVVCNCCCYSSNQTHGSDGGLRDVWGPLFDRYRVDLVISGHVHAYERTNPMRAGQPTAHVRSGGTVRPETDGTTYICAGGGGNGLYRTWYGPTLGGDPGSPTRPKVWRWSGGDTATGGSGHPEDQTDTATEYSAHRRAVWSCLVVDVTAPQAAGHPTSMKVRALMPEQTSSAVTSVARRSVIDSVTLVRTAR